MIPRPTDGEPSPITQWWAGVTEEYIHKPEMTVDDIIGVGLDLCKKLDALRALTPAPDPKHKPQSFYALYLLLGEWDKLMAETPT